MRYFVKTTETTSIINGEKMLIDGSHLLIYDNGELVGMYLQDAIIDAHRTEGRS